MRHYEVVFISHPDLSDEEKTQIVETYRQILADGGAEILLVDDWGRRRLAYEIKKVSKGYYTLFEFASKSPDAIFEMERRMRLDDQILRFLTIKKADVFDREAYEAMKSKQNEKKQQEKASSEEPAKTDSAKTDSVETDSAETDSAETDSVETDSAETDSVETDSAETDSAETDSKVETTESKAEETETAEEEK